MESRLTDLEIRLTHHEASLEEINAVLLKQQAQLDALGKDMATLQRQLRDLSGGSVASEAEETPPPHY